MMIDIIMQHKYFIRIDIIIKKQIFYDDIYHHKTSSFMMIDIIIKRHSFMMVDIIITNRSFMMIELIIKQNPFTMIVIIIKKTTVL